jgi:hypothetical protein
MNYPAASCEVSTNPLGFTMLNSTETQSTKRSLRSKRAKTKPRIANIKAQIRTLGDGNPNFYQDACRTLELSKRLFPLFLESSYEEKASILKLLASNYALVNASDVSILPTIESPST